MRKSCERIKHVTRKRSARFLCCGASKAGVELCFCFVAFEFTTSVCKHCLAIIGDSERVTLIHVCVSRINLLHVVLFRFEKTW